MKNRLRELDFLRGIAILLVLLCHIPILPYTSRMGWIGVDLFFVLSGYLVSGLLFKEYLKFGSIRPKLFLIRRGFKIYPIYYIFYIPYLLIILISPAQKFNSIGFLSDMFFVQNLFWGWGYAYFASWSLSVEEHFYVGFSILLWLGIKYNWFHVKKKGFDSFSKILVSIFILCLILRIVANTAFHNNPTQLFTATPFRIDSLLMGVLIAYFYNFRLEQLTRFFEAKRKFLYAVMVLGLSWTPFINAVDSFFAKTFGFALLYVSFGILLVSFLISKNTNQVLDRLFSKTIVDIMGKIGFCSYSIYIIHTLVINISAVIFKRVGLPVDEHQTLFFFPTITSSIAAGMLMTYKIEAYFLKIRDTYFPGRV